MSFIDKYENKKPTKDDLKKMDSEVVNAIKSGALARSSEEQIKILEEYIEEARKIFKEGTIMDLIDNIAGNINNFKETLDLFRISDEKINNIIAIIKGACWNNYRAQHHNLPLNCEEYFKSLSNKERVKLINDIYNKAIKGNVMMNLLEQKYQDILNDNAA